MNYGEQYTISYKENLKLKYISNKTVIFSEVLMLNFHPHQELAKL